MASSAEDSEFWLTGKLGHAWVGAWVVVVVMMMWWGRFNCSVILHGLGLGMGGGLVSLNLVIGGVLVWS